MDNQVFVKDFITINTKEIPVEVGYLSQEKLKFYEENPRIYSIVNAGEDTLSQEEIEERLCEKEHVLVLVNSIRANGGLTDPIIVRGGDFVVLEGNSRLAAYRILAKKDPIKWGNIKSKILPKNISNDLVFNLLGEYHIIGRKDWQPYEQAGYLYRRHKLQNVSLETIQNELGFKKNEIKHLIEVYSFMLEKKETDINRWSYYEEYLKSSYIEKIRSDYHKFDDLIVDKINKGEIGRAIEIRDRLIPIAKSTPKNIKNYATNKIDTEEAYSRAISGGAGNVIFERLHKFREWIAESSVEEEIQESNGEVEKKCNFELEKISKRVRDILNKLNS